MMLIVLIVRFFQLKPLYIECAKYGYVYTLAWQFTVRRRPKHCWCLRSLIGTKSHERVLHSASVAAKEKINLRAEITSRRM